MCDVEEKQRREAKQRSKAKQRREEV